MFKTHLLFKGGSARDATAAFFAGLGATIPPITPPAPEKPVQPATPPISGTVTLAAEPPRSRKTSRSRHANAKGDGHKCAWKECDRVVTGKKVYCGSTCRKRAQRDRDKVEGVRRE